MGTVLMALLGHGDGSDGFFFTPKLAQTRLFEPGEPSPWFLLE